MQAAGKSSFFKSRFADTHVRINLDMLRTRHRERALLQVCLDTRQPFVVDNTNLTVSDRARYVEWVRRAGFRLVGYRFRVDLETAIARNAARNTPRPIPEKALVASFRRWEVPTWHEGFDELHDVYAEAGSFRVVIVAKDD